jgi:hypothetical protein
MADIQPFAGPPTPPWQPIMSMRFRGAPDCTVNTFLGNVSKGIFKVDTGAAAFDGVLHRIVEFVGHFIETMVALRNKTHAQNKEKT